MSQRLGTGHSHLREQFQIAVLPSLAIAPDQESHGQLGTRPARLILELLDAAYDSEGAVCGLDSNGNTAFRAFSMSK